VKKSLPKHVLITGGAGFIGSHLADRLLAEGCRVTVYDNFSYGRLDNLDQAMRSKKFRLIRGDIRNAASFRLSLRGINAVYHLAAYKIPRYGDALETLVINGMGSHTVLAGCASRRIPVILASTSDVYGMNPRLPFGEENMSVIGPPTVRRWAYAVSKMFEEQLAFAFHEKYQLAVTCVRFFGGYGPRQNLSWWGGPQSVFISQALSGLPMEIHGNGRQTRSFTYIDDHVEGLLRMGRRASESAEVVNLGSNREISIVSLARMIWSLIRKDPPKIRHIPYRKFGKYQDVVRRVPDLGKTRRLLGFTPCFPLEKGLRKTIMWQKSALHVSTPS